MHVGHIRINSQCIHSNIARRRRQIADNVCIPHSTHQYVALLSLRSAAGQFENAIRQTEMDCMTDLTAFCLNGFITIIIIIIITTIISFLSVMVWVSACLVSLYLSFGLIISTAAMYFLIDFLAYRAISSCVNSDTDAAKYLKTWQLKDNTKRREQITRRFLYEFVSTLLLSTEVLSELHRELFVSPECTTGVKAQQLSQ
jgi:hypothetical protein